MEIELKYLTDNPETGDKIIEEYAGSCMCRGGIEEIEMDALYYDTSDLRLSRRKMAYRVRKENGVSVATLKWGGKEEAGLHIRGEINIPLTEDKLKTGIEVFSGEEIYNLLKETIEDRPLLPVMEVKCLRRQVMVHREKSESILSYDKGEIITSKGRAPVSELEIELYRGNEADLMEFGGEIKALYGLKEGKKSKFQVGLELLGVYPLL